MSEKKKKLTKKQIIIISVSAVVILALVGTFIGISLSKNKSDDEVKSAVATKGNISTSISASSSLQYYDASAITMTTGVTVEKVNVSVGSSVSKGDVLATVDSTSLQNAISTLQNQIKQYDTQISTISSSSSTESVTANVAGRVKAIFVSSGSGVKTVMGENNALMLLSLDGYMKVEFDTTSKLASGSIVIVKTSDGLTTSGTVFGYTGNTIKILIDDEDVNYLEEVAVYDKEGNLIGNATAKINSEYAVVATSGKVESVDVSLNAYVVSGRLLISLYEVEASSDY